MAITVVQSNFVTFLLLVLFFFVASVLLVFWNDRNDDDRNISVFCALVTCIYYFIKKICALSKRPPSSSKKRIYLCPMLIYIYIYTRVFETRRRALKVDKNGEKNRKVKRHFFFHTDTHVSLSLVLRACLCIITFLVGYRKKRRPEIR